MSIQIIPLTSEPNQNLKSTITIDGVNVTLQFNVRFNEIAGYWVMTITDQKTNTKLIDSMPLLSGGLEPSNILAAYSYLKIGSAYLIDMGGLKTQPTDLNLGTDFVLAWGDTIA